MGLEPMEEREWGEEGLQGVRERGEGVMPGWRVGGMEKRDGREFRLEW